MTFRNTYQEPSRAQAYNELDFGGTYRLVADCLPVLLAQHIAGSKSLDFGCGTGRSTRFLNNLGYQTIGVDVSTEMIKIALENDPAGDYRAIPDGDLSSVSPGGFNLILCAFPFDNIPGRRKKTRLFTDLRHILAPGGKLVNIVSTPEIYLHEWVTFTTRDFPENRSARCGDTVKIITKAYSDGRPVDDILWPDEDYQAVYRDAGLIQVCSEAPLATGDEGIDWISETTIAPWRFYVLGAC